MGVTAVVIFEDDALLAAQVMVLAHNTTGNRWAGVPGCETLGPALILLTHIAWARHSHSLLPHWHFFMIPTASLKQMEHLVVGIGAFSLPPPKEGIVKEGDLAASEASGVAIFQEEFAESLRRRSRLVTLL